MSNTEPSKLYYGKTIVKYDLRFGLNGFEKTNKTFLADKPKPYIVPAKNCTVVLDGCSVGNGSLFELSGINLVFVPSIAYKVTAFGFCLEENYNEVETQFIDKARAAWKMYIDEQETIINKIKNQLAN